MKNLVYFDMDGVLANFDAAYDSLIGKRKPNNDVYWEEVAKIPNFFLDLPLMPLAKEIFNTVPEANRMILSSIPYSIDQATNQKRDWLKKHFNLPDERIILVRGKSNKKTYAQPDRILVDDWEPNILDWRTAGGIGLLYTFPNIVLTQLQQLMELNKWP